MSLQPECPECDKLHSVKDESQIIGNFLDWLFSNGKVLCKWEDTKYYDKNGNLTDKYNRDGYSDLEGYYPTRDSIENLLAEYFEVNMDKVNKEREELLNWIQKIT
jgi:hypothetical protein